MNKLYSIILGNRNPEGSEFAKITSYILTTPRGQNLRELLCAKVPDTAIVEFAYTISWAVLNTAFGADIQKLDSINTYKAPESLRTMPLRQVLRDSVASNKALLALLDKDLQDLLSDCSTRMDFIAAACLQLLREILV